MKVNDLQRLQEIHERFVKWQVNIDREERAIDASLNRHDEYRRAISRIENIDERK